MPSPRYWREIPSRYRLEASRCGECGRVSYPPRHICPACRRANLETVDLSHEGRIVTWTVVHVPPTDLLMQAPYALAVVETPEGARMMTQVVDCDLEALEAGMHVVLEFRLIRREGRGGILCYGHKAVPAYPLGDAAEAEMQAGEMEVAHA